MRVRVLVWSVWEEGQGGTNKTSSQYPHMPTFEIPTGPSITEWGHTSLVSETPVCHGKCPAMTPSYRSITYDRQKGEMPLKWVNEDAFLAWLAAEECENAIKLIVSRTEDSDSPNWRARRVYRCLWEFSGGKQDCEDTNQSNRKITAMKTGCQCRVTIKMYPHTETILGKYEGNHNHALGDDNLRFLRLTERNKIFVMDMVCMGMDSKAIVSDS